MNVKFHSIISACQDSLVSEVQQSSNILDFPTDHDQTMAKLRAQAFLFVLVVSIVLAASMPSPGGGHHEHTHFIIHVPELIHKHHHTHVKKIHIKSHDEDDGGHQHIEEW
ncbi:uncharacterized protein LOC100576473 isoform X2 [Apis mellifera]|uniref:Uncharacterized protein LOC100576473 isoform X2 n=1 Tax=Apis mellifera TaxID=7460 RepID=A0A7M7GCI9_APIME|nr:uncharacterized protein LOC100576473 isoform X2 [Apis mellifera]|eukprot:XP_003251486.1 uncharacterized protein LOC100576473 isoform X2 [Apis mellifera]